MKFLKTSSIVVFILFTSTVLAQLAPPPTNVEPPAPPTPPAPEGVVKISQTQVTDSALYFDGNKIEDHVNYQDQPGYDFFFGPHISPHGDCIDFFGKYVFLTWYKGGEENRHVMLSRYDTETGTIATIQFDHRHTGYLNNPNIGESHNTIAVGISPLDSTIHLLYDMHAYSATRPEDGSFANDYFRYQYSVPGAVAVSDAEFTKSLFFPKQLYLKEGENYEGLTYPEFFPNLNGELMVKMRIGGNNNGKFVFATYNPTDGWSSWTDFNITNAANSGVINYNWGLYGNFKYQAGKMRIGFATRYAISTDKFTFNNGFHYAYSNDPTGKSEWFNAYGEPFNLPLIDPDFIKISEPGDEVPQTGVDEVRISTDADWAVNDREDVHFVNRVNATYVHTYRKAGDTEFTTTTEFPGGDLHGLGNNMYLVNLEDKMPVIYRANGGTNDWIEMYRQETGNRYMFGIARIHDGKLYYYLMREEGSVQDANPTDLLVYDLADSIPAIGFLNISDNDAFPRRSDLTVKAATNDPYNNVSLYVNEELVSTLTAYPYTWSNHPLLDQIVDSTYTLKLVAVNAVGDSLEKSIMIKTIGGQEPYTADGLPHPVPGLINFTDYDKGGENVAYFDRSGQDPTKYSYRGDDNVDMSPSGTQIVYIQGSDVLGYEWLEYTINVAKTGFYDLFVTHEKGRSGTFDQLQVTFPDEDTVLIETFMGRDRETQGVALTDLMGKVKLTAGEHVLRFTMLTYGFNLESFEFVESVADPIFVTFNYPGDTLSIETNEDGTVNFPADPVSGEQIFVQWVTVNNQPVDANTIFTESVDVYPQWEAKTYLLNITAENGTVNTSPDQLEFQLNSKVKITAIPNDGYEFIEWSGDVTGSVNPMTITVKTDLNITATFAEIVVPLGLNNANAVKIYPNPSDQYLFIEGPKAGSVVSLFDLSGSIVKTLEINESKAELDVSNLKSGQYILLINGESSESYYQKIIIR